MSANGIIITSILGVGFRVLVSAQLIANACHDLFAFVLHANKKLSCFLSNITSAELICADPRNRSFTAFELHILGVEGNAMTCADFVAVVTIHNDIVPNNNRVPTPIAEKVLF